MGTTYLMSYPGPNWQIRGGENFRSEARAETNPRQALREWLTLCDAMMRAGGHILVMPPPEEPTGPLTGIIYTANAGQLFHSAEGWTWLVSKMGVAHRKPERAHVKRFIEQAGMACKEAAHTWEGQADLQSLASNRYIATWGVRSERASLEEVKTLLGPGARFMDLQLRDPFFHGDTCLDPLVSKAGDTLLLCHDAAFPSGGIVAIRKFVGDKVDVLPIEREDALGYACNSLCVNGTLFIPTGLSTTLRGQLARRGFSYEELELTELFGKGGGGPRCLVNELRGMVANPGAPDYASLRESLYEKLDRYPEKATPLPAAAPPPSKPPA